MDVEKRCWRCLKRILVRLPNAFSLARGDEVATCLPCEILCVRNGAGRVWDVFDAMKKGRMGL
jgi:hypothetical protein